jgi:hypothetical protein
MQRSWYDVHEEAAGEAEEVQVGEGEGGEAFMKMMTALPAQKEEQEQQEREEMEISGFVQRSSMTETWSSLLFSLFDKEFDRGQSLPLSLSLPPSSSLDFSPQAKETPLSLELIEIG